jgi:hypothetical protein
MPKNKPKHKKKVNYKRTYSPDRIIQLPCGVFITEDTLPHNMVLKLRLGDLYPQHIN